jgi:predicted PurR-regulated permease PerM
MAEQEQVEQTAKEQEQVEQTQPEQDSIEQEQILEPVAESPNWDRSIKIVVAVVSLIVVVAVASRFTGLLLQIVAAGIIAYVLTPTVNLIVAASPLKRGTAILITYLLLALAIIGFLVVLGVNVVQQINAFITGVPRLVENLVEWFQTTDVVSIGPLELDVATIWGSIDWIAVGEQLQSAIVPVVNQGGRTIVVVFGGTVQVLTTILFTFIVSIYLAFEMGRMGGYLSRAVYQPGYRLDTERLLREFDRIWQAYLRGQVILGVVIGLAVWISLTLLGVQNAFALGILSGLLEFLPVIGPFIGTAAAAIVAFFQPSNYLGLDPLIYMLLVIGVMILIQQIENNVLVPRIVGGALDLHPLIVILGVFMGAALAGLIGAILAAPVLATLKLLSTYAWRKMFDLPPFSEEERPHVARGPTMAERVEAWRRRRAA